MGLFLRHAIEAGLKGCRRARRRGQIGAKDAIPDNQARAIIAVGLRNKVGVMEAMNIGRYEDLAQDVFDAWRKPEP